VLPDYPKAKNFARSLLLKGLRAQLTIHEPLLQGVSRSIVHEGRTTRLTRADSSTSQVDFVKTELGIEISREEMKNSSPERLQQHISAMAKQLAEAQVKVMLETAARASDEVGNTVSAAKLGEKEAFLEVERRRHVDFNSQTMEPLHQVIVMSPSMFERYKELSIEWEKDPMFVKELERIRAKQIEDWRARENRRQLAD
jgi:hypothetical protein